MSIMSIYRKENNNKSIIYIDVNYLLKRFNIIRVLYNIDNNCVVGDCKYQFSAVSDTVKKIKIRYIINAVDFVCDSFKNNEWESTVVLDVIAGILNGKTARIIQQELHISMSTYCKCRFILVNKVATFLEREMWHNE